MKANRKFLNRDDAVSPVIAVILMVAITVVLAATVYVWVSGFGAQSSNPAKTISVTSNAPLSNSYKNYTVASASPGMKWSDLSVTIDGAARTQTTTAVTNCADTHQSASAWVACNGLTVEDASGIVNAGDTIKVYGSAGNALRLLDANANSVMLTLTIG